jgi:regulator of protease activity HflC (stomatin/prohibitin superfamily)
MFNALLPDFIFVGILLLVLAILTIGKIRYTHIVSEGHVGLLYHKGKFVRVLAPGRHVHWGRKFTTRWVDVRRASILVPGQDVLTADNVGLKLSLLVTYQVADPAKATHETQNWSSDLHNAAQLALRSVVGGVAVEALLNQRLEIGAQLLARVQPEAVKIGVNVLTVEVKDVMFPADLKRAFADVLKAKQEGQAALERARGESAALRNLANAARVLEGNPALMNLRLMQSLSAAQNAGNTLVLGVPGFVPLKNGKAAPAGDAKETGGEA